MVSQSVGGGRYSSFDVVVDGVVDGGVDCVVDGVDDVGLLMLMLMLTLMGVDINVPVLYNSSFLFPPVLAATRDRE